MEIGRLARAALAAALLTSSSQTLAAPSEKPPAPPAKTPEKAPAKPAAPGLGAPATWKLSQKLGPGSSLREALVRELCAKAADRSESALTPEEAQKLLDDPRAELVYGERTVAIVAPSMVQKQRADHVDLLKLFLKPERIEKAVEFVRANGDRLEAAGKKHKVDPNVVVSILMWESKLGTVTGDYNAFNVFTSQAYFIDEANQAALSGKGPQGAKEKTLLDAKSQQERVDRIRARAHANLLALVRMAKSRGMDPLAVKGSWAGALGFPQFMPASLRWAEDGDGDGKVDLFTIGDSIASIANYLEQHGFAKDRAQAVWAYNHEQAYVDGVLAFADAVTKQTAAPAPAPASTTGADAGTAGDAATR